MEEVDYTESILVTIKERNWTFKCCGPQPTGVPDSININMMGQQPDGSDDGGQYYYDLALALTLLNKTLFM